jgi:hypothetical protein
MDFTIGRKGFLAYLKSLGGSNVVKVVPSSNGDASGLRVADKRLKVVCGANTSYLDDMAWVGDKTPLTLCDVRVSPSNAVKPNLGALELSEALSGSASPQRGLKTCLTMYPLQGKRRQAHNGECRWLQACGGEAGF